MSQYYGNAVVTLLLTHLNVVIFFKCVVECLVELHHVTHNYYLFCNLIGSARI